LHDAYLSVQSLSRALRLYRLHTLGPGGREYGREGERGEVTAVLGSFPYLTEVRAARRWRRQAGRPGFAVRTNYDERLLRERLLDGRGCVAPRYRLWPLLCGSLL